MRVVTKCGKVQPAASAEQYLRMVCDELAYLEKRLREQAYSARCPKLQVVATGELVDYEGFHWEVLDEAWATAASDVLSALRCPWPLSQLCKDAGHVFWRCYAGSGDETASAIPAIIEAKSLPSDLKPGFERLLPRPPRTIDVLHRLSDAYNSWEHDMRHYVTTGECRGHAVVTGVLHDPTPWQQWVISPFKDGGPDPYDYREEPPYSEYTLEADELSYLKCVWPPGTGCSYWRRFQVMPPFTDPACHDAYDARRRAVRMSRDAAEAVIKYPTL